MIAAVVLAAGGSTRLGRTKQLLQHRGRSLVRRAAEAAIGAGCAPVVVVLGADAARVGATLRDLAVQRATHPGWADGLASSIRRGLDEVARLAPQAEALALLGCDQPHLDARVLAALIAAWRGRDAAAATMAASAYGGVLGGPAVFGRETWHELAALAGDRGASALLRAAPSRVVAVAWPEGILDVDEAGDLSRLACDDPDAAL